MPEVTPDWLAMLAARVAETGNRQAVADEIGISRTAVSLLLAGKYTASTDRVAAKIAAAYCGGVACPFLELTISRAACARHAASAMPMSDPAALKHWVACRTCPQKSQTVNA